MIRRAITSRSARLIAQIWCQAVAGTFVILSEEVKPHRPRPARPQMDWLDRMGSQTIEEPRTKPRV